MNVFNSPKLGFYGKLPIVGDFVTRRLPDDFTSPWDRWLQSAISASREQLGDTWLSLYLTSPIWRFVLAPGVCGNRAVAGIVMPSVDKVGRYFPFTIAVILEDSLHLSMFFSAGSVWFEQLEDAALLALEGKLDLSALDQLVESLPVFGLPDSGYGSESNSVCQGTDEIRETLTELEKRLSTDFNQGCSLWCKVDSSTGEPVYRISKGLPSVGEFADFLKGKGSLLNVEKTHSPSVVELDSENSIQSIDNNLSISGLCWSSWAITDKGLRRQINEDAVLNRPDIGVWVVADGMGGHQAGSIASQLIIDALQNLTPTDDSLNGFVNEIQIVLQNANTQLRQLSIQQYANQIIGSTVVVLVCDYDHAVFLWSGDSRLYLFRDNQLRQLTQDHCEIDDFSGHSGRLKNTNVITRAVGAHETLELDIQMIETHEGDIFLLSSDGLDKELSFDEIEFVIQHNRVEDTATNLIDEVLARGARDNVSVVVVSMSST